MATIENLVRTGISNAAAATLMAILVVCLSRPLARRPAVLHGLWVLVLLKLVTPPLFEVPVSWPAAPLAPAEVRAELAIAVLDAEIEVNPAARGEALEGPRDIAVVALNDDGPRADTGEPPRPIALPAAFAPIPRWIGAVWLAGSAMMLVVSLRRIRRFRRMLADARRASWLEQEWVDDWARRMGLRRAPELLWAPGRISPMVWYIGPRPRLIVPDELWKGLDGQQRSTLLAHELAHLRRGDHRVRLLEFASTALYWWHPLVWWLRGPLREAEEQCCDAWVLWALPDAVRSYAETLLDTLEFLSGSARPEPLLASGLGKVPLLRRRLTMIMTGSARRLPGFAGKLGLLVAASVLLPIGATRAQKSDDNKEFQVVVQPDPEQLAVFEAVSDQSVAAGLGGSKQERAVVVLRVDGQDKPATVTESGTIDDVVKKLQARIAELKKDDDSPDASRERIKALTMAIDEIKKVRPMVKLRAVRGQDLRKLNVEARVIKKESAAKDSPEIQKLSHRVSQLRKNLEATVHELEAAQNRIRKLGGDPGDVPVVSWKRTSEVDRDDMIHTRLFTRLADGPHRVTLHDPVGKSEALAVTVLGRVQPHKSTKPAEATADSRIEALEKRLKALVGEVERLKRGSANGESRK